MSIPMIPQTRDTDWGGSIAASWERAKDRAFQFDQNAKDRSLQEANLKLKQDEFKFGINKQRSLDNIARLKYDLKLDQDLLYQAYQEDLKGKHKVPWYRPFKEEIGYQDWAEEEGKEIPTYLSRLKDFDTSTAGIDALRYATMPDPAFTSPGAPNYDLLQLTDLTGPTTPGGK